MPLWTETKQNKTNFLFINETLLCFLSKKETHEWWKQEQATQEECGDIAQARELN